MNFSDELKKWLEKPGPKTVGKLNEAFSEKSIAIVMLILLFPSATPLPTGGVTYILEIIAMIVSLQLIIGRSNIWLPKRFLKVRIGEYTREKVLPRLFSIIHWAEKKSRHNLQEETDIKLFRSFLGVLFLVFTFTAFISPPFTGIDTLPSLAVVLLALAVLVEDRLIFMLAILIGIVGSVFSLLPWIIILR